MTLPPNTKLPKDAKFEYSQVAIEILLDEMTNIFSPGGKAPKQRLRGRILTNKFKEKGIKYLGLSVAEMEYVSDEELYLKSLMERVGITSKTKGK